MIAKPALQVVAGHPGAPAQLQQLGQVELVNRNDDEAKRQVGKAPQLGPEHVGLLVLQGIVEQLVPVIEQHGHVDQAQIERDDGHQQAARLPLFFGLEVGFGQGPGLAGKSLEILEFLGEFHQRLW